MDEVPPLAKVTTIPSAGYGNEPFGRKGIALTFAKDSAPTIWAHASFPIVDLINVHVDTPQYLDPVVRRENQLSGLWSRYFQPRVEVGPCHRVCTKSADLLFLQNFNDSLVKDTYPDVVPRLRNNNPLRVQTIRRTRVIPATFHVFTAGLAM